jgi:hypothetical protein
MKKLFIISAVLLVVVLVFLGIYNIAFKPKAITVEEIKNQTPAETKNSAEKISAVSDVPVMGVYLDKANEKLRYYSKKNGTVWESELDGTNKQVIESVELSGLKSVQWTANGQATISEFFKDGNHSYYQYNHDKAVGSSLDEGVDYAVWSNTGNNIIYKYYDRKAKKRSLNLADPDGKNWKKLADLDFLKVSISSIPQTSLISFWNYPSANEETKLSKVGIIGGDSAVFFSGRYGADFLWSPDGTKALVSSLAYKGGSRMTTGLLNMQGEYQDLNIPTLANKATWSADGKSIYYALPVEIPQNAVMPDDYQSEKINTKDTFWKVNVETGKKDRLIEPEEINADYDATNLILANDEGSLYFVNRRDGLLYRLKF